MLIQVIMEESRKEKIDENPNQLFVTNQDDDDELVFADEDEDEEENIDNVDSKNSKLPEELESIEYDKIELNEWKILLVDDEDTIHSATKLALSGLIFEGKSLNFLSAFSGEEAKTLIKQNPDTAVIFLDIIMETENAGLEVIKYIRDELNNKFVRIIIFTGQPGQVPEGKVIIDYDINDYKVKNELTRQKLLTKVITSFRGFKALVEIEKIARQNAKLCAQVKEYAHNLEQKVKERTKQLAQANQELEILAKSDGLTKVANRHYFNEYLSQQCQHLASVEGFLSLILIDVDFFKKYNDHYGHLQGDDCLQKVAQVIHYAVKRPTDLVARYGGEEFAVILPNTSLEGAISVAQEIQSAINRIKLPHAQSSVSKYVTVSIGVYCCNPEEQLSPEVLINNADEALYQAKRQGRNRLSAFGINKPQ